MTEQPLTEQQLTDIETRANAATPGPWCTDSWEIYQGAEYEPGISMWIGETCRGTASPEQDSSDAEFVAAARTDVPALLAEVRRLRADAVRRVQCNDCGAVGEVFTGDDGLSYLDPSGQIGHGSTALAEAGEEMRAG